MRHSLGGTNEGSSRRSQRKVPGVERLYAPELNRKSPDLINRRHVLVGSLAIAASGLLQRAVASESHSINAQATTGAAYGEDHYEGRH